MSQPTSLPRVLGALSLISLGVGGTIGSGIFVIAGTAARELAGPAVIVSFLVAALACGAAALCYARLAARFPEAGSAYAYAHALCPPWLAWLVGWNLILQYLLAAASIAQGWSHYFQDGLGTLLHRPHLLPNLVSSAGKGSIDLPAAFVVVGITAFLLRGMTLSARLNHAIVVVKLLVIGLVLVVGLTHLNPAHWQPFAPFGWGAAPRGMLAGAAMVVYAFLGFEAITNYSEEAQRPQESVPRGILGSLALCTLIYMAMALVLTGVTRYDQLSKSAPVSDAFGQIGLPWVQSVVALGALMSITSVLVVILLSFPRILLALGRHTTHAARLSQIDSTSGTPRAATIGAGALVGLLALLVPLDALGVAAIAANLVTFIVVAGLTVRLNRRLSAAPVLTLLLCVALLMSLPGFAWPIVAGWLVLGGALYPALKRR